MMHRVTISTFGVCHTLDSFDSTHSSCSKLWKISPVNILKNILKMSENHPVDGMLNTLFQFAHTQEDTKVTAT